MCSAQHIADIAISRSMPHFFEEIIQILNVKVEWDAHCQHLIRQRAADGHVPKAPIFSDVRKFELEAVDGPIDGLLGGFPCQVGPSIKHHISSPLHTTPAALQGASKAGRMEGMADGRTKLLAEFFRLWDSAPKKGPKKLILGPISECSISGL